MLIYFVYVSLNKHEKWKKKHTYPSVIHSLKTILIFQGFYVHEKDEKSEN